MLKRKKTSFQADFEHASKRKKRKKIPDLSQHNLIESMIGYATVSFDNIHQAQEELYKSGPALNLDEKRLH